MSNFVFSPQAALCAAVKQEVTAPSYRVFHSSSLFAQTFSFLPAHLLQHLPSFVHFTDLPVRETSAISTSASLPLAGWHKARHSLMDGGGGVVSLENALAAHRLPPRLGPVFVLGVLQRFAVLVLVALRRRSGTKRDWPGRTGGAEGSRPGEATLTCRPYLAFICFSSFCRRASLSSLEGAGPAGDGRQSSATTPNPPAASRAKAELS